jgi:hydroxymethylglutaryl-CoA lyase
VYLPPLFFRKLCNRNVFIQHVSTRFQAGMAVDGGSIAQRVGLVNAPGHAGLQSIEVTSPPTGKATNVDESAVWTQIDRLPGVSYVAFVSDMAGAERALMNGANEIRLAICLSETKNLASSSLTTEQSAMALKDIIHAVHGAATVGISVEGAFGDARGGTSSEADLVEIGDWFAHHGASSITLCDTESVAHPILVERLGDGLAERWKEVCLGLELYDANGMALANVLAGMSVGIHRFSASLARPVGQGTSTSTVLGTENLVWMLHQMECTTGVCADRLAALSTEFLQLQDRNDEPPGEPSPVSPLRHHIYPDQ